MSEAIRIALDSVHRNGGPFGAVIVREEAIVGRGSNEVTKRNDPTAHAEVLALRDACERLSTFRLSDCDLYTSCEPCPMCLGAIYWAHIRRVFYASTRADAAAAGFDDDLIYREIGLPLDARTLEMRPLLRSEALAALAAWKEKTDKRPY
jgi:tRNA(Arg) A34 adenosine deaminase TadA